MKLILSCFYFLLLKLNEISIRLGFKKQFSFLSFVISVGNLTAGGAGKTPMIVYLSELLSKNNTSHAIISRGYKKNNRHTFIVSNTQAVLSSVEEAGDEPFLLAKRLAGVPVVVGEKKTALDIAYNNFNNSVSLLDDGFQSHSILKNFNILLVDLSLNINNYRLLPVGLLREPLGRAKNADLIIFTKCNYASPDSKKIKRLVLSNSSLSTSFIFDSAFIPSLKKYSFRNRQFISFNQKITSPCVAFSGIAHSDIFRKNLSLFCENKNSLKRGNQFSLCILQLFE